MGVAFFHSEKARPFFSHAIVRFFSTVFQTGAGTLPAPRLSDLLCPGQVIPRTRVSIGKRGRRDDSLLMGAFATWLRLKICLGDLIMRFGWEADSSLVVGCKDVLFMQRLLQRLVSDNAMYK